MSTTRHGAGAAGRLLLLSAITRTACTVRACVSCEVSMAKKNVRYSNGHRRRQLRKRVASLGLPCAICGKPIDYSLEPGHPMSYELDEKTPVALGGDPLDPRNVQPAHRICNERKGASFAISKAKGRVSSHSMKGATPKRRAALPLSREW